MKISIGVKIIGSFVFIALCIIATSLITYFSTNHLSDSYSELIERRLAIKSNLQDIRFLTSQQALSLRGYMLTHDKKYADELYDRNDALTKLVQKTIPMVQRVEVGDLLKQIHTDNQNFKIVANQAIYAASESFEEATKITMEKAIPITKGLLAKADEIVTKQQIDVEEQVEINSKSLNNLSLTLSVIGIILVILAIVVGMILTHMIAKPIQRLTQNATTIASGDLTVPIISVKSRDEIYELAQAFNLMKDSLLSLVMSLRKDVELLASSSQELTASAGQTTEASEQIASLNQEVVFGTEEQLNSLHESVQSMKEVSTSVGTIASHAQSVSQIAEISTELTTKGENDVNQAVVQIQSIQVTVRGLAEAIQELGTRSQEISAIVNVIGDIAEQTNLLALNVAIEAARAGEHGRGFNIVANEIRKLSEQSADSSKRIGKLVQLILNDMKVVIDTMTQTTDQVGKGSYIVLSAGESFKRIHTSIVKVAEQIQEVSASSLQVSAITQQVTNSIQQVTGIAENTSSRSQTVASATEEQLASMEEIASSSTLLSEMAEEIQRLISQFKVREEGFKIEYSSK